LPGKRDFLQGIQVSVGTDSPSDITVRAINYVSGQSVSNIIKIPTYYYQGSAGIFPIISLTGAREAFSILLGGLEPAGLVQVILSSTGLPIGYTVFESLRYFRNIGASRDHVFVWSGVGDLQIVAYPYNNQL